MVKNFNHQLLLLHLKIKIQKKTQKAVTVAAAAVATAPKEIQKRQDVARKEIQYLQLLPIHHLNMQLSTFRHTKMKFEARTLIEKERLVTLMVVSLSISVNISFTNSSNTPRSVCDPINVCVFPAPVWP